MAPQTDQRGNPVEPGVKLQRPLTNPIELCDLLTRLNVTKDPQLEEARRMLEKAVRSHDVKDLRDSAGARVELRSDVQTILDKFSWE